MITNEIIENCTKVIKENGQKIFFAVMTMLIVSHFSLIIAFGFVMLLSAVSSLLTFALLAVILVFTFGLFFGFCVLMLLFTRGQYGVIGHLFYGFKDLKRLLRASLPFVLILFGSCFAASVFLMVAAPNADPFALSQDDISGVIVAVSYGAIILSILLYLPFVFTPFTVFDFADEPVKNCIKRGTDVFKNTYRIFFKGFVKICKKDLCLILICAAVMVLGTKSKTFSSLAALAIPFGAVLVYIIFTKTVILCAGVYNQFLIEQNGAPESAEENLHEETAQNTGSPLIFQLNETETTENNETDEQGDVEL